LKHLLKFDSFGGGTVLIDTKKCKDCASKVCAEVCQGDFIRIERGIPVLSLSLTEIRRGACTECLACELDCRLSGQGAIEIVYPMPELDEFLHNLDEKGLKPVWRMF
jgi:NAD-dependent dihydropyrimidine dehydrogenase PreA subunit